MVHVLIELVEEAIWPGVDVSGAVNGRADDLIPCCVSVPEEMDHHVFGDDDPRLYRASYAVKHMVAVSFDKHLNVGSGDLRQKTSHHSLSRWMKVHFGVLNEKHVIWSRG